VDNKNRAREALGECLLVLVFVTGCAMPTRLGFIEFGAPVTDLDLTERVPAPVIGGLSSAFFSAEQYWRRVEWEPDDASFSRKEHTAIVTLETMPGWSFSGVRENSSIHQGAADNDGKNGVTNEANSGRVTIRFPEAEAGSGLTLADGFLKKWDGDNAVLQFSVGGLGEGESESARWFYAVGTKDGDNYRETTAIPSSTNSGGAGHYEMSVELEPQGNYEVYVKVEQGDRVSSPLLIFIRTDMDTVWDEQ
jgi:hypothetical protein